MPTAFHHALDRGDHRTAGEWLVRLHATAVLALCRGYVRDEALAEDLCQDTFARALGGLSGFRGESEPRTWLLAIARNRCLDELRRQGRNPVESEPDIDEALDDRPLESHLLADRQAVEQALSGLSERERAMVLLRYVHGLGYPELADAFGIRQGAARMRLSRALARMRATLEQAPEALPAAAPSIAPASRSRAAEEALPAAAPRARRRSLFRRPPAAASPAPSLADVVPAALPPDLARRLHALVGRQRR